jgi:AcrR family transcriptional regulator
MPKLAQKRAEQNRRQIEQAALRLFTRQGFHGTNIREIAERAQVSTGAIYTYFPTKDALYESVVRNCRARAIRDYQKRIESWLGREFQTMEEPFSRQDLERLAGEIRSFVYDQADYWKLMYVDVVEFNNRHFADSFQNVPEQLNRTLDAQRERVVGHPAWCGIDPGFALATVYMQILTYFLVERLFAGNQHLGVPNDTAIGNIIEMSLHGLWRKDGAAALAPGEGAVHGPGIIAPVQRRAVRSNQQPDKPGRAAVNTPPSQRKARRPGLLHRR